MSAPEPALPNPPPAASEELQFQRAEYAEAPPARVCSFCKSPVGDQGFEVSGTVACAACLARVRELQAPVQRGSFGRAILFGLGAAIAGSIIFALVSLTGFQFSIVAILVGVIVGKAIRKAMMGQTTRAAQILAVVLTYGAITTSYLPMMFSAAFKAAKAKRTQGVTAAAPATPTPQRPRMALGAAVGGMAVGSAVLIGFSLIMPFLLLTHSPLSGFINLLIIFIGLRQAWRLTTPSGLYVPKL